MIFETFWHGVIGEDRGDREEQDPRRRPAEEGDGYGAHNHDSRGRITGTGKEYGGEHMAELKDLLQSADWKAEKHVPVIEAPAAVKKGEFLEFKVVVGKEIPHPNKTEHHIRWVAAYFHPDGSKFPYEIGRMEFNAHGEGVEGPDTSTVYTYPVASMSIKTEKPGTIHASSYCNVHGLWMSSKRIDVLK